MYESNKSEELVRLNGIMRFLTDNKIKYRISFEGERLENFLPEDEKNSIILERVFN